MVLTRHIPLVLALLLGGCFADSNPAGEGETGAGCPEGSSGCACYGNMTCDGELVCDGGFCVDPQCIAGTENCPCLPSGGCDVGLVCEGVCKPPAGTSSADASATSVGSETGPGDSGVMSSTGPVTTGPGSVDASMSDPSVSDTSVACPGCPPGEVCDPMGGFCIPTAPYVPCGMTGCDCLTGPNGENVCAPPCDNTMGQTCLDAGFPLPPPSCIEPMTGDPQVCVLDCTFDPNLCPPEMVCTFLANPDTAVCMWP